MNNEPTYKKIINLLDFAEELIPLADPGGPEYMDANPIFMTLVHIEEVLDTYGRGMAHRSMVERQVVVLDTAVQICSATPKDGLVA